MTDYYVEIDSGTSGGAGTSWATARDTLENGLALCSAGDRLFVKGTATDTAAASRTFTTNGTVSSQVSVYGCKDATTATPPGASDLVVKGTDTLPHIEVTGALNDMTFAGFAYFYGLRFTCPDRFLVSGTHLTAHGVYDSCEIKGVAQLRTVGTYYNCDIDVSNGLISYPMFFYDCTFDFTGLSVLCGFHTEPYLPIEFYGCDLSNLSSGTLVDGTYEWRAKFQNCKLPATYTAVDTIDNDNVSVTITGSDDTTALTNGSSIQQYSYEDLYGTVDLEITKVRTGGATDGATGSFSYAMQTTSSVKDGTEFNLKSPWLSVWVDGGASTTLTVYIANDAAESAANDLHEDEIWLEAYTPDASDTAQYDRTVDPSGTGRFLDESTTSITDDTGSTWGTGANNHQKLSVTVTPGYTGYAYVRVCYAKSTTPPEVYIDPEIEVT